MGVLEKSWIFCQ